MSTVDNNTVKSWVLVLQDVTEKSLLTVRQKSPELR
jgi:hypothetical protein